MVYVVACAGVLLSPGGKVGVRMKLLLSWLREYCPSAGSADEVADELTRFGLEVERIETLEGGDAVLEVEVTSNRSDWQSYIGIARDLAAIHRTPLRLPAAHIDESDELASKLTRVEIENTDLCPRYTARVVKNVKIAPSPEWLRKRLVGMGLRPINNVVDITNFVLFETGQPLHAFDYDKLAERRIVVRQARYGERITSIDGTLCVLDAQMLVIADAARPVAVAGVMGGLDTEVGGETSTVLLESAYFDPASIKETSRELDLASDSSYRFERGVDPEMVEFASRRAAGLMQEIAHGEVASGLVDVSVQDLEPVHVALRFGRIKRLLGHAIPAERAKEILSALAFEIVEETDDHVTVAVPSHRLRDVSLECDLVEELARIEGYDKVGDRSTMPILMGEIPHRLEMEGVLAQQLIAAGFYETVGLSFVNEEETGRLSPWHSDATIRVPNAVNQAESALRKTLAGSLLRAKQHNRNRGVAQVRIFEIARAFLPLDRQKLPLEKNVLGVYDDEGYRSLKGVLEHLLAELQITDVKAAGCDLPVVQKGKALTYEVGGRLLGYVGSLATDLAETYDVASEAAIAELDVDLLAELARPEKEYQALPRFPTAVQDVALVVDEGVTWGDIEACVRETGTQKLVGVEFFDEYRGKQVGKGKKSLAFSMTFRADDHTLTSTEVEAIRQGILAELKKRFGAALRT